jgi:hypothetical protein
VTFTIKGVEYGLVAPAFGGRPLRDQLLGFGAIEASRPASALVIGIGNQEPSNSVDTPQIQLTWDGWVAALRPFGVRLPERKGSILSAVLASSLAMSEAFQHFLGDLDAGWRPVTLSLWDPLSTSPLDDVGPTLDYLPASLALVGLGHIGQAHAWCLSLLPYLPSTAEVWLVDDDSISYANLSTGAMTTEEDVRTPPLTKARMVARSLESSGFMTRILEIRLPSSYHWEAGHPPVALVGVDNVNLRRRISSVGWPLSIDGGLGATPSSYSSFSIHIFPGAQRSEQIQSWLGQSEPLKIENLAPAFRDLAQRTNDECGILQLAERAVATTFVGMTEACFAVSEVLRRVNGGVELDALSLNLDSPFPRGAVSTSSDTYRIPTIHSQPRAGLDFSHQLSH